MTYGKLLSNGLGHSFWSENNFARTADFIDSIIFPAEIILHYCFQVSDFTTRLLRILLHHLKRQQDQFLLSAFFNLCCEVDAANCHAFLLASENVLHFIDIFLMKSTVIINRNRRSYSLPLFYKELVTNWLFTPWTITDTNKIFKLINGTLNETILI